MSAMSQYGNIENISTRPCSRGVKIAAEVVFRNLDGVKAFKEAVQDYVYIGKDLARVRKIGTESVAWEMKFVAKLSGLPVGTNDLDLADLLGEGKANFVKVPRYFTRDGKQWRYQREAFVYFATEEDMKKAMETPVKIGDAAMFWGDKDEKRCRQCNKMGHIMRECRVYQEMQKTKEHMRAVKEYQRGGALRVTSQQSFAKIVG
ncbi:hypothetical protein BGZ98_006407, partial [Dissophora globulifera]